MTVRRVPSERAVASRKTRRRANGLRERPASTPPADPALGFPDTEHHPYTVEGEIEQFGAFFATATRRRGCRRVLIGFVVLYVVLMAIALILRT